MVKVSSPYEVVSTGDKKYGIKYAHGGTFVMGQPKNMTRREAYKVARDLYLAYLDRWD